MRNIVKSIESDLKNKFVFIAGPRQVGKTYLSKEISSRLGGKYYSWDLSVVGGTLLEKGFLNDRLVVLDELHKYDHWKNFIKGIYDKYHESLKVIVTGSARLDIYRRGGDSLMGRYYLHHLHPLTMGELARPTEVPRPEEILDFSPLTADRNSFENLLRFSGFPEPFFSSSEEIHNKWSIQRRELLVREEIRDLTNISMLGLVEHLMLLLPSRVGSPLSINSLREDLQISYNTVKNWLEAFQKLYISFHLKSYTGSLGRSIQKEQKLYLWDWSQISDPGARFENLVAGHLWKAVHLWRDNGYGDYELWFLRDRDRREVDFCITKDNKPFLLVEAKLSDTIPAEPLDYFSNRLKTRAVQIVATQGVEKKAGSIPVLSADKWLGRLP